MSDEDVAGRALRGIPWVLASVVSGRLLALVTMLVLARLLDPATIGVVLTALVIVRSLNVISDNGLAISLVVRPELPERMVGTVLSVTIGLAIALAALLAALAGPVASLFGEPRLADVLPVLSVTVVFSTLSWLLSNLLQREMLFRPRFFGQFALVATNAVVAIPLAAFGLGIWSMVAGQVAATLVSAAVLWGAYPGRLVPALDVGLARLAFRESRGYIAQGVTVFLSDNAHFIAVSSVLGARPMALYSTSYRIAMLPSTTLAGPVSEATFPAYAGLRDHPRRRTEALLVALRFVVTPSVTPLAILAVLAGPFVAAVLGPRWDGMAPVLAILCAWGMLMPTAGTIAWFLNAVGDPRYLARINIGRLAVFAPALFLTAGLTEFAPGDRGGPRARGLLRACVSAGARASPSRGCDRSRRSDERARRRGGIGGGGCGRRGARRARDCRRVAVGAAPGGCRRGPAWRARGPLGHRPPVSDRRRRPGPARGGPARTRLSGRGAVTPEATAVR